MTTRTTAVGTLSGGSYLTAAAYNDAAGGWIGYVEKTTDQGSVTVEVDVASMSTGPTVGTSRRIRVSAFARLSNTSAVGGCALLLYEGATLLQRSESFASVADGRIHCFPSVILTPSAGVHTYKLRVDAISAGTVTLRADATYPCYLLVEDIGPA